MPVGSGAGKQRFTLFQATGDAALTVLVFLPLAVGLWIEAPLIRFGRRGIGRVQTGTAAVRSGV